MSAGLLRQFIETENIFGVEDLPKPTRALRADKKSALSELYQTYKDCARCGLQKTRKNIVFGEGSPEAHLMFVGEAPGQEEDQQGLPFVGAAGQLLTKILEAMKIRREDVYIVNCLKCRPPNNRNPLPDEIVSCNPILQKQIEIIQPRVICALGKFASQTLLSTEEPISQLRGRFHDYQGIKLMPTFHPSYLLRNPADKKLVWADMQIVMRELGSS